MKHGLNICLFLILTILSKPAFPQTSKIISGSTDFSVKFIFGTCHGTFDAPKGTAIFNEKNPEYASFNLNIAAATFDTGNNTRDKDMISEKYFFVSKYPEINFKSSKVEKKDGKYQAIGMMKIRDVTKTVTLPFDAKKNADGTYALSSTFEINRLNYKLGEKDFKLKDVVTVNLKAVIK